MGLEFKGGYTPENLAFVLRQGGERVVRRARETMKREADLIVKLAKSNAPVDKGDLEESIRAERTYEDNQRLQIAVIVGGVGDVDSYALAMEEGLAPYGSGAFNLGPRSREKAAAGNDVGGKYLERAWLEREEKIPENIFVDAMDEGLI